MCLEYAQWAHHVESASIPRGYYIDTSRTKFRRISSRFYVLFRCIFAAQKIQVVSTYYFRRNFADRNVQVISTPFFWCNFSGQKFHVVFTYFFRCNIEYWWLKNAHCLHVLIATKFGREEIWRRFWLSCKLIKHWGGCPLLVTLKKWLLQDFSP